MGSTTLTVIAIISVIIIAAGIAVHFYKKRNIKKLFESIQFNLGQVPKNKKNSFILLMLIETMTAPMNKGKAAAQMSKLNNPKYLNLQMMQMTRILSNPESVKDKRTKQALKLHTEYRAWEESQRASRSKTA
ncbi:MAG: hypothetical protein JXR88_09615 [Clostridia bacterium]|nr:hypothetical protein [Clostridia bacterium]